jgi:hypothetical protein
MRIEIVKDKVVGFQVRVVNDDGQILRMFVYRTIEGARVAAAAWRVAFDECEIVAKSGVKHTGS